jgi:hypothetical protein
MVMPIGADVHQAGTVMARRTTVHVSLELQVGSDPLRGEVETAGGLIRPFAGWLELIEALDRLAGDPQEFSEISHDNKGEEGEH